MIVSNELDIILLIKRIVPRDWQKNYLTIDKYLFIDNRFKNEVVREKFVNILVTTTKTKLEVIAFELNHTNTLNISRKDLTRITAKHFSKIAPQLKLKL